MFDTIANQLKTRKTPLQVFFRNDDGGWANTELNHLCEWFTVRKLPLDIACIPNALDHESVTMLKHWLDAPDSNIHLHQHGYSHKNHQLSGRSCEFGSDRNLKRQVSDITQGKQILSDAFDGRIESVFTPPWNRCTNATIEALHISGFNYLSRIKGSEELQSSIGLLHQDVAVDWLKKKDGSRLSGEKLIAYIARQFDTTEAVLGIMLHHEHMHKSELDLLEELVQVLRETPAVSFRTLVETATSTQN